MRYQKVPHQMSNAENWSQHFATMFGSWCLHKTQHADLEMKEHSVPVA